MLKTILCSGAFVVLFCAERGRKQKSRRAEKQKGRNALIGMRYAVFICFFSGKNILFYRILKTLHSFAAQKKF